MTIQVFRNLEEAREWLYLVERKGPVSDWATLFSKGDLRAARTWME